MKDRLIVFDLDGVLVDSKEIHFVALNNALRDVSSDYCISYDDHVKIYDGLPTKEKLNILTRRSGLEKSLHNEIWINKQKNTEKMFSQVPSDPDLMSIFKYIKSKEIKIAVASNSIKNTVTNCLTSLGILSLVDLVIGNEDVQNPKPHPEMYWKAMSHFGTTPSDTIIFEDSVIGILAATSSGAGLVKIKNRSDLTLDKIKEGINILSERKNIWTNGNINVLIPMAGAGSRFSEAGYSFPKPLIDVDNKPMIHAVVDNLAINAKYTYIVQKSHYDKFNLDYLLNTITPDCNIVQVEGVTDGAAITCLLAKDFINSEDPLVIANSDQIVDWNSRDFLYDMYDKNADGGIVTFLSTHPKWSYAKADESGMVVEVAEKKPISSNATVGIYYWKHGSDFVKYAEEMVKKDIRVNGEFYTCPVFNEAIQDNKRVYISQAKKMWGIGTPEDLMAYLRRSND
jgi:beta-phosphoglucomutase-like phosphatase (HAD superfamily)/dTDP-glucose pyrophosphorylase